MMFKSPAVRSGESSNIISQTHQPNAGHSFLLLALVLMLYLFLALVIKSLHPSPRIYLLGIFGAELLAIGLPVWLFARLNRLDFSKTFPFRKVPYRTILLTILIALSGFVILAQINILLEPLFKTYQDSIIKMQTRLVSAAQYNIGFFLIGVALLPAICEEFLFRGIIFSGLRNSAGKTWALIVSSLLFGLMHLLLPQVVLMTLLGLLLGVLFILTDSLIIPMLAHFINNTFAILGLLNINTLPWLNKAGNRIPFFILFPSIGLFIFSIVLLRYWSARSDNPDR